MHFLLRTNGNISSHCCGNILSSAVTMPRAHNFGISGATAVIKKNTNLATSPSYHPFQRQPTQRLSPSTSASPETRAALSNRKTNSSNESNCSTGKSMQLKTSWGQQCSPNCGCVVRFEVKVDDTSQEIVSASYHAKSIVATKVLLSENQGTCKKYSAPVLKPLLTNRTNRPMLKECKCNTLHHLSAQIIQFLQPQNSANRNKEDAIKTKNWTRMEIQNMLEFSDVRASTAFRHTVLKTHGLSEKDTHCFDLVEEAFTAMVKGYMLRPRRNNKLILSSLLPIQIQRTTNLEAENNEDNATALDNNLFASSSLHEDLTNKTPGRKGRAITKYGKPSDTITEFSAIDSSPSNKLATALKMFDMNQDDNFYSNSRSHNNSEQESTLGYYLFYGDEDNHSMYHNNDDDGDDNRKKIMSDSFNYDWVTYVDELYEKSQDDEEGTA